MSVINIAIVGSNGFIGKHLAERLRQAPNVKLFLFGKSAMSDAGHDLPYTQINLSDAGQVTKLFAGIDLVYYLASETIPATSWETPVSELQKNLIPFIQFTECIARLGVKKIVFLSSAGTVYGAVKEKITEDSNKKPFSPYGITKLTMEYFLNYFEAKYKLRYDVYRVSNVYGEGQDTSKGLGIINTFLEKIITEKKVNIFGDGENLRNYIYVKDVVELLSFSAAGNLSESNTYNLSSNDTVKINDLVRMMKSVVQENFEVIYTETRQSDNSFIDLDNSRLAGRHRDFIFTGIEDGIKKTYAYLKKQLIKI